MGSRKRDLVAAISAAHGALSLVPVAGADQIGLVQSALTSALNAAQALAIDPALDTYEAEPAGDDDQAAATAPPGGPQGAQEPPTAVAASDPSAEAQAGAQAPPPPAGVAG